MRAALTSDVRGMKIGVPGEAFGEGSAAGESAQAIERCDGPAPGGGSGDREVALPHSEYIISDLLHPDDRRGIVESRAVRRRAVRLPGGRGDTT